VASAKKWRLLLLLVPVSSAAYPLLSFASILTGYNHHRYCRYTAPARHHRCLKLLLMYPTQVLLLLLLLQLLLLLLLLLCCQCNSGLSSVHQSHRYGHQQCPPLTCSPCSCLKLTMWW
jgi:hypothetical protein